MIKKKNGFTLIELIAVLVILAIIALIASPLVMNTVRKVKDSANKRSVDGYGRAVELAIATYLVDHYNYPTNLDDLKVEYTGNKVVCNVKTLNEDGSIYLSECSVKGIEVKDTSTEDGWYHYGKTTKVPLEEPVVYQEYNVGDVVIYNGMDFYVIEDSDENSDRVTMLKAEPLTYEEIQNYSAGTGAVTYDRNGYGGLQYGTWSEYETSYVKVVVEAWTDDKLQESDLTEDSLGYKTRLITFDELLPGLGYDWSITSVGAGEYPAVNENVPSWVYNSYYSYWTMSPKSDSVSGVWIVHYLGNINDHNVGGYAVVVRPVITLLKTAI